MYSLWPPDQRGRHLGSWMLEEAMQLATGAPMATGGPRYRDGHGQPHRTTGSQGWGRCPQVRTGHTPPRVQVLMVSPGSVSPGDLRPRSPPGVPAGPVLHHPPSTPGGGRAGLQPNPPSRGRLARVLRRLRMRTVPAGLGCWFWEGLAAPPSISLDPSSLGQGPWPFICAPEASRE